MVEKAPDPRDQPVAEVERHPQRCVDGHAAGPSPALQAGEDEHAVCPIENPVREDPEVLPGAAELSK